jgi:hypothetical protein
MKALVNLLIKATIIAASAIIPGTAIIKTVVSPICENDELNNGENPSIIEVTATMFAKIKINFFMY